jgi:hypothetical protein
MGLEMKKGGAGNWGWLQGWHQGWQQSRISLVWQVVSFLKVVTVKIDPIIQAQREIELSIREHV